MLAISGEDTERDQDGNEPHHRPVRTGGKRGNEDGNHQANQSQPPAGEPFPVQDKDEAHIDQGASGFAFGHNDEHGENDDGGGQQEVLEVGKPEVLLAQHEGEQQGG